MMVLSSSLYNRALLAKDMLVFHPGCTALHLLASKFEPIGKTETLKPQKYESRGIAVFGFVTRIGAMYLYFYLSLCFN